jgi:hypothetical protein
VAVTRKSTQPTGITNAAGEPEIVLKVGDLTLSFAPPKTASAVGVTADDVRRIALSLPATTEKLSYGTPGFRVSDRLFARIREEGDVLVVWTGDLAEKEALIASEPDKFFTTPHYHGHPTVLVRFGAVTVDELSEVLTESWRVRAPKRTLDAFGDAVPGAD